MSSLKATPTAIQSEVPWYKELTGYHWWVLIVASLGWLFDTMDQRIFVLVRQPAMEALLPTGSDVKYYSGIATTVFMIGWAVGGLYFSLLNTRVPPGRVIFISPFAASNSKMTPGSILTLSCAVASSGIADCSPGG